MKDKEALGASLRELAERSFPANAISQDPQTLSYGKKNLEFLGRCSVDLDLAELDGFHDFAFHLTAQAYSVLVARTLLKYLTLLSGSHSDADAALHSQILASFLNFFSNSPRSSFLIDAMSHFNESQIKTLRESGAMVLNMEMAVFDRDISYLDEVEDFVAWIDQNSRL